VGRLPEVGGLRAEGLQVDAAAMEALLSVDADAWQKELEEVESFLLELGARAPQALLQALRSRQVRLRERKAA
jgi:GTP-dependent phosphoenolpyruvate carboxykinase